MREGGHDDHSRADDTPLPVRDARRLEPRGADGGAGSIETLDLRGLKCPLPVLHVRRALARSVSGAVLDVRCTDPLAALDIPNLVRETGDTLLTSTVRDGEASFRILKARSR